MSESKSPTSKPKVSSSFAERELDRVEQQFDQYSENIKKLTDERQYNESGIESEPQAKISRLEAQRDGIWLKPEKAINAGQKFNERFRSEMEFQKEYVNFIAQNNEIIGEAIEIWTRPFGGMDAEFWKVPVNKSVWGPRYLAEQIKRKFYHRLKTDDNKFTGGDGTTQYYGQIVADTTIQRLDAFPVTSKKKSLFSGSGVF